MGSGNFVAVRPRAPGVVESDIIEKGAIVGSDAAKMSSIASLLTKTVLPWAGLAVCAAVA